MNILDQFVDPRLLPEATLVAMSTRVRILVLAGLGAAWGTVATLLHTEQGPAYGGRSLQEWVELRANDPNDAMALDAICRISSNCLPQLVRALAYDSEQRASRVEKLGKHLPAFAEKRLYAWCIPDANETRAEEAAEVLRITGHRARAAVPELTQLAFANTRGREAFKRLVFALLHVNEDPAQTLEVLLLDPARHAKDEIVSETAKYPRTANHLICLLLPRLKDIDRTSATFAAEFLGDFARRGYKTNVIIMALGQAAQDPRKEVSGAAQATCSCSELSANGPVCRWNRLNKASDAVDLESVRRIGLAVTGRLSNASGGEA